MTVRCSGSTTNLLFLPTELLLLETHALCRQLFGKDGRTPKSRPCGLDTDIMRDVTTYWASEWTVLDSFSVRYVSYSTSWVNAFKSARWVLAIRQDLMYVGF